MGLDGLCVGGESIPGVHKQISSLSIDIHQYVPEILPLNIRAKGSALAAGADFLGNFLVCLDSQSLEIYLMIATGRRDHAGFYNQYRVANIYHLGGD